MGRFLTLLYAGVAYAFSQAALLYTAGWLGDVPGLPTTIDGQPGRPLLEALAIDLALLSLFAVQHSVMARPAFKKAWTKLVPPAVERSTYVLASGACLFAVCLGWQSLPGTLWRLDGGVAALLWVLYAAGWMTAVASTYMVNHADLFGLRQALQSFRGQPLVPPELTERYLYRFVRHPIMVGMLIAFWSAPWMTSGRFAFALLFTAYILAAVRLEERDLTRALGAPYEAYRERIPMLIPRIGRRPQPTVTD